MVSKTQSLISRGRGGDQPHPDLGQDSLPWTVGYTQVAVFISNKQLERSFTGMQSLHKCCTVSRCTGICPQTCLFLTPSIYSAPKTWIFKSARRNSALGFNFWLPKKINLWITLVSMDTVIRTSLIECAVLFFPSHHGTRLWWRDSWDSLVPEERHWASSGSWRYGSCGAASVIHSPSWRVLAVSWFVGRGLVAYSCLRRFS